MDPGRIGALFGARSSPAREAARQLEEYLRDFVHEVETVPGVSYWFLQPKDLEAGRRVLALPPAEQTGVLVAALERRRALRRDEKSVGYLRVALANLVGELARRKLPCTEADVLRLLDPRVLDVEGLDATVSLFRLVERYLDEHPATPPVRAALAALRVPLREVQLAPARRLALRIGERLGDLSPGGLNAGEAWADAALAALRAEADAERRAAWEELLTHARSATAGRPSAKWLANASALAGRVGRERVVRALREWLPRVPAGSTRPLDESNAEVLKGLLWCCLVLDEPALAREVGEVIQSAFRKVPQVGQRSAKVGNAGLHVLGQLPGPEAVVQLARLQLVVRQRSTRAAVGKALAAVAEREGITPRELEEMSVPTFGLDEPGRFRRRLGGHTAEVVFPAGGAPAWSWRRADGRAQKSVPAAVRDAHAAELAELRGAVRDVQAMLPAQRERLERLYLENRTIRYADWRARYLDHPLVGQLARRLIWSIGGSGSAILGPDGLVDAADRPVAEPSPDAPVALWHPVEARVDEVLAWRRWVEGHEVRQPFKQAHREVYLLTEAEVRAHTYSNRFAAHVLKQHQMKALADQKGWSYALQGAYDADYDAGATLDIPAHGLRAELWVDSVAADDAWTDAGIYLYVSTDQVRFVGPGRHPRPLVEVPRIVLSEVMRTVDLFVGVASIGNDPNWQDGGGGHYRDYWRGYSFGELSAAAETRRAVLERLLPRLAIASRSRIQGRFLVVEGTVRTYKIHLGSGNILMEPDDQYLCIVPDRTTQAREADARFIPFEGDRVFAVILSKALMLADDGRITDPTILSQIRGR
ncbi:MAG: DUF4132 domain-containing protein [Longimicrobiaceae bacterium]